MINKISKKSWKRNRCTSLCSLCIWITVKWNSWKLRSVLLCAFWEIKRYFLWISWQTYRFFWWELFHNWLTVLTNIWPARFWFSVILLYCVMNWNKNHRNCFFAVLSCPEHQTTKTIQKTIRIQLSSLISLNRDFRRNPYCCHQVPAFYSPWWRDLTKLISRIINYSSENVDDFLIMQ